MKINKLYKFIDEKYSPIIGFLIILPNQEFMNMLELIKTKMGLMYDYFGFEYEPNDTLTFYDFTTLNQEKSINISL